MTFTVGNHGTTGTRGDGILTVITAFYVNIDRGKGLPSNCKFRLKDPDPTIPEVVRCTIPPGLEPGKEQKVAIPMTVDKRARFTGTDESMAIVAPAPGSPDRDPDLTDNRAVTFLDVIPPTPPTPSVNLVGLYLTHDIPPVAQGASAFQTLQYGNVGPHDMVGQARIVYVTPFFVNVDRSRSLPDGCVFRLQDPDPTIPEMVVCTRPALKAGAAPEKLQISVTLLKGAPNGHLYSLALIAPDDPIKDASFDQTDTLDGPGVLALIPLPAP
jgi:hypothetical protein